MQDESTRGEKDDEKEVRAANMVKDDSKVRCYECQDMEHIGADCPNRGKGKKCYKCNRLGNHVAATCPYKTFNQEYSTRGKGYRGGGSSRYKNFNNSNNQGRDMKRKTNFQYPNYGKRGRGNYARGGFKQNSQRFQNKNYQKKGEKQENQSTVNNKMCEKNKTYNLNNNNLLYADISDYDNNKNFNDMIKIKFLADSGATDHISNSKIVFKTYEETDSGII